MPVGDFPLSGVYAQHQAAAEKLYQDTLSNLNTTKQGALSRAGYTPQYTVDPKNPYGGLQQIRQGFAQQRAELNAQKGQFTRDYGLQLGANGRDFTVDRSGDNVWTRMDADHNKQLTDISDARNKVQYQEGLKAKFDGDMNPLGLDYGDNAHGEIQDMLSQHGLQLDAIRDDALGRGLGTRGLGNKAASLAQFSQQGSRQQLKDNLVEQLKQAAKMQGTENTDYTRHSTDLTRSVGDTLDQFIRTFGNLDYNQQAAEYNFNADLQSQLAGIRAAELGANQTRNSSNSDALLDDLLARIKNGEFNAPPAAPKVRKDTSDALSRYLANNR